MRGARNAGALASESATDADRDAFIPTDDCDPAKERDPKARTVLTRRGVFLPTVASEAALGRSAAGVGLELIAVVHA